MAEAYEIVLGRKPGQSVPGDWVGEFDEAGNAAFHLAWEKGNKNIDPKQFGYLVLRGAEIS